MNVHEQACFQDHVIVLIFKVACAQDGDDDDEVRASARRSRWVVAVVVADGSVVYFSVGLNAIKSHPLG
jgi:hypothetical protein